MYLEEIKARNDCAGASQQQFIRPTNQNVSVLFSNFRLVLPSAVGH
jgi:hypothetical protein